MFCPNHIIFCHRNKERKVKETQVKTGFLPKFYLSIHNDDRLGRKKELFIV